MTGTAPMHAALRRAYRKTHYASGSISVHVGCRPKNLRPDQHRMDLVFLGACNPGGRKRPDRWNNRMMERLRFALRRVDYVEATGSLGRWSENMLMASMDPRRAEMVARRFRQNAILVIRKNSIAQLVFLETQAT